MNAEDFPFEPADITPEQFQMYLKLNNELELTAQLADCLDKIDRGHLHTAYRSIVVSLTEIIRLKKALKLPMGDSESLKKEMEKRLIDIIQLN